jgi:iron complex outermembrane receptor protein
MSGGNVLASWHHVLTSGSDFQIKTYYDRTERQELNFREVRSTFDVDFIHHIPFRRNDVTWGLGARTSPGDFTEIVPTVLFTPPSQTYNILSAFAQDEIALVPDRLSLTIGAKLEYTTFSDFDYQPNIRLAWTPNLRSTAWASVTRAIRTPSRIEDGFQYNLLTQQSPALYLRLIGDGTFDPEQLLSYEVGYRRLVGKRGVFNVNVFHNRYTNLLSVESSAPVVEAVPAPAHLVLPLHLRNGLEATSTGGELIGIFDPRPWWRLRGSYAVALMDAKRAPGSNDASTVRQLEGDSPAHTVVIQSGFQLPRSVDLNFDWRYVSAVPDQNVRAYSTADARLGWRIGGPWEVEAVGRNLLQPAHYEYGGLPGPLTGIRRSAYAGIIWRH